VIQVVTGAVETAFGVTLNGLGAPQGAAGMRAYRGDSAYDLLYLCDIDASLNTWTDSGGSVSPMRPPRSEIRPCGFLLADGTDCTSGGGKSVGSHAVRRQCEL